MSRESRTDALYSGLTALQRAVLLLEAARADHGADPLVMLTMPDSQTAEFNGYMSALRNVTRYVGPYVITLGEEVAHLRTRLTLVAVLCAWGIDHARLGEQIESQINQPCSQQELESHLEHARAADLPLEIAVDMVVDARNLWEDIIGEQPGDEDARYRKVAAPIEAELRGLVASKHLAGRGRGKCLQLNTGSFYDWIGEPVDVPADWGLRREVVPGAELEWRRDAWSRMRKQVEMGPHSPLRVLETVAPAPGWLLPEAELTPQDALLRATATSLANDLARLIGTVAAVDLVVGELQADLAGHDPLPPLARESLEHTRTELEDIRSSAAQFVKAEIADEPNETALELLRVALDQ